MHDDTRRAFGEDRLEAGGDEMWLHCPAPKSWLARRPRTLTTAEYPGTAVEWQGGVFEVLDAQPQADGSIRYRLTPWGEAHAIRRMERYDEASEAAHRAEQADRRQSVRRLRLSILLAPLAGMLPGDVQKAMANEFGAPALLMTLSSAAPLTFLGGMGVVYCLSSAVTGASPPEWLLPVSAYVFGESICRAGSVIAAGEPMGSLPVVTAYQAWREHRARKGKGKSAAASAASTPPQEERDAFDRFRMLEPFLALLDSNEQALLAERFLFEPIRWGRITAWALLIVGGVEAGASLVKLFLGGFGIADAAWLLAGGFIAFEQVRRLRILRSGAPAGSVLGAVVRLFVQPLLAGRGADG